jgi:hypothetical protein
VDKLEKIWEEVVEIYFKMLFQTFPARTVGYNNAKCESGVLTRSHCSLFGIYCTLIVTPYEITFLINLCNSVLVLMPFYVFALKGIQMLTFRVYVEDINQRFGVI